MPQLPELVQALLKPKAYPEAPQQVEMVQTQMSFVFLTDNYVYKVKKPVNLGYLDYTTLNKRHFYCQREVELNRRLCPDVYLGVVPITRNIRSSKKGSPKGRSPFGINSSPSPFQGEEDKVLAKGKDKGDRVTNYQKERKKIILKGLAPSLYP